MKKKRISKVNFNSPIITIIALILGIIISIFSPSLMKRMSFIGSIYLKFLEMCVGPLVFLSILYGCVSFTAKKMGQDIIAFFKYWFSVAICLSIIGVGLAYAWKVPVDKVNDIKKYSGLSQINISDFLESIVPDNVIGAFSSGNVLQLIVLAILISIAIKRLGTNKKAKITNCLNIIYDIQKELISVLVKILPIGVFFLAARIIENGNTIKLKGIIQMIICIYVGYLLAFLIVYPIIINKVLKEDFREFFKKYYGALIISFLSCSSSSAFPIVIEKVNEGNDKKIIDEALSGIALVLKHVNCIQTPIYCIFIAKMNGIPVTITILIVSCFFGIFSSIGTAGIPSGGIVMIAVIFRILELPIEYVSVIAGIYALLDMPGTSMNVLDDCIGLTLIKKRMNRNSCEVINS